MLRLSRASTLVPLAAVVGLVGGCASLDRVMGFGDQVKQAEAKARIFGTIESEGPVEGTLVVGVAAPPAEGGSELRGVDSYSRATPGTYLFVTDPGAYYVGGYEDRNQDGLLGAGERVVPWRGSTLYEVGPGERLEVNLVLTDDSRASSAELPEPLDVLGLIERDVREQGRFALWAFSQKGAICDGLADPRFRPEHGTLGLWRPMDFMNEELAGIYFMEPYDDDRIPVLFVHGIGGHPRQFQKLIDALDEERFQAWLYFYPSGFSLQSIASHLSQLLGELHIRHDFDELAIVAHSMGGLVSRGAVFDYAEETRRRDIRLLISISTPWGGDVKAERAGDAPVELPPSFADMNPSSPYMKWIHFEDEDGRIPRALPKDVAFHMIWGFGGRGGPCNDGSVTCASQAMSVMQEQARSIRSWDSGHVQILNEPLTIDRVNRLLEDRF